MKTTTKLLHAHWADLLGILVLVVYAVFLTRICFLPALAADEIAFFVWADKTLQSNSTHGILSPLFRENLSGYGPIYWTLYVNCISLLEANAVWAMRGLAYVAFLSIPVALALVGKSYGRWQGWLAAALWLSMPIAWWCGKLTGPDTFAMAFAVYGNLLILRAHPIQDHTPIHIQQTLAGWFLVGLALALKLVMLPAAVFALLVSAPLRDRGHAWNLKTIAAFNMKSAISLSLGFVVGCPIVIFDCAEFLKQLTALPNGAVWQWQTARLALSNETWTWDGVFSGGLVQWSLAPILIAAIVVPLASRPRVVFALACSFLICWGIIVSKGALLGWYWFGWVPMLAVSVLWVLHRVRRPWVPLTIATVVVINAVWQAPSIAQRYQNKAEQARALQALPQLQQELTDAMDGQHYDVVLDYWEVAYDAGLTLPHRLGMEVLQTSPPAIVRLSSHWSEVLANSQQAKADGTLARASLGILSDVFVRIGQLAETGTEGKVILVILSKRLASKQSFHDFKAYLTDQVIPKSPPGTHFRQLVDSPSTAVYVVSTRPPATTD